MTTQLTGLFEPAIAGIGYVRGDHPLELLFERLTGICYRAARVKKNDPNDMFSAQSGFVPSVGYLTKGLRVFYDAVRKPKSGHALRDASGKHPVLQERNLVHAIEDALGERLLFLELGSGVGFNTMRAGELGMAAYGIELRKPLFDFAEQMLQIALTEGIIAPDAEIHLYHGNYLPKAALKRLKHKTVGFLYDNPYEAEGKDVYDMMQKQFSDFHFYYSYPWSHELRFFDAFMPRFTTPVAMWYIHGAVKMIHIDSGAYCSLGGEPRKFDFTKKKYVPLTPKESATLQVPNFSAPVLL